MTIAGSTRALNTNAARVVAGTPYGVGEAWLGATGLPIDGVYPQATRIDSLAPEAVGSKTVSISCGWGHSAVVDASGCVRLLGRPHDFKNTLKHINTRARSPALQSLMSRLSVLLHTHTHTHAHIYTEMTSPPGDPVQRVVCGPAALTALLTASGRLYMLGQNFYGQCGHGIGGEDMVWTPVLVRGFEDGERVVDVACGFEHVLACTNTGALYAWGRGDRGQLGHGDTDAYQSAARVLGQGEALLDAQVHRVAAGPSSSAAVTTDGRVFVWGKMMSDKEKEVRGGGAVMQDQLLPRQLAFSASGAADSTAIQHVTAGQAHFSFLAASGDVWMTGLRGRGVALDETPGESAVPDTPEVFNQSEPLRMPITLPQSTVALRSDLHHSYAVDEDGSVTRWGWKGRAVRLPSAAGKHVLDVSFGYNHAIMLVHE